MKFLKVILSVYIGIVGDLALKAADNDSISVTNQETALKLLQDTEKNRFLKKEKTDDYKNAYEILKKELSETNISTVTSLFYLAQAQNQSSYDAKSKKELNDTLQKSLESFLSFKKQAGNIEEFNKKLTIADLTCGDILLRLERYTEAEQVLLSLYENKGTDGNGKNEVDKSLCLLYAKTGDEKNEAIYEKKLGYLPRKKTFDVMPKGGIDIKASWNKDVQGLSSISTREQSFQRLIENSFYKDTALQPRGPIKDIIVCKQAKGDPIFLILCRTPYFSKENSQEFKGHLFIVKANGEMIKYSNNIVDDNGFIGDVLDNGYVQMGTVSFARLLNGKEITEAALLQIDDCLTPLVVAYTYPQKELKLVKNKTKTIDCFSDSKKIATLSYDEKWISDSKNLILIDKDVISQKRNASNEDSSSLIMSILEGDRFLAEGPIEGDYMEGYSPELLQKAENGDAYAQYNIGTCYDPTFGGGGEVEKDAENALKWYRKSASQGNPYGQLEVGKCFSMGIGVEVNHREAVKWFRKSAEQGNGDGQSCLGTAYNNGDGVATDFEEALKWALLAQKNGKETERTINWLKQMIDQEKASERKDRQIGVETVSCSLVDSEYNNGDTFLLKTGDGVVFDAHLYGVDAFETSNDFPSLVAEQAKYFGITNEQAIELGNKAREFIRTELTKDHQTKTIAFTTPASNFLKKESNNKPVLNGEIIVDGESLACLLVKNGLVKIYGTIPHTHPEYIVSREKLLQLEAEAKREKVGGWGLVKSPNVESSTNPQQNP